MDELAVVVGNRPAFDRELSELMRRARAVATGAAAEAVEDIVEALRANAQALLVLEEELHAQNAQLEEAYRELVAERQRFRTLFEHAPVGYVVTDLHGVVRDANAQAAGWVGRDPLSIVGKPLPVYVSQADRCRFRALVNRLGEVRGVEVDTFVLAPVDQPEVPVAMVVSVLRDRDGKATGARWVVVPDAGGKASTASADGRRRVAARSATSPELPPEVEIPSSIARRVGHAAAGVNLGIVHGDNLFAHGLRMLLDSMLGDASQVVFCTPDRLSVDRMMAAAHPEVLLVDITDATIDLVTRLKEEHPEVTVVALTAHEASKQVEALDAGADGVLPRAHAPADVLGPVLAAGKGWVTLPRELAGSLVRRKLQGLPRGLDADETRLLQEVAAGASSEELGRELHLSVRTVKRRVADLYRKLGVEDRVQAAALAGQLGLVDPLGTRHGAPAPPS